ncbi:MAG: Ku protein [Ilumatobacter sp.]|nr:Ku protein [Ilumatobacter sp.]
MARPVWSGTISFGLIAIPVKLFHAVRRQSVSFNQLDERNMARIRYRKVNAETGEEVSDAHIVKGYEIAKGRYVVVDPDELEPFMPAATKSVDLEEFVDLDEIDPVFFDTAYHLAPDGAPKPYVLLARAMEASGKVAIGRFVMRNKQYTAAIRAEDGRLVMSSLAYADEVVDPGDIEELEGLDDVEVNDREVAMAESLVESLTADFEPHKYHDEYREQVMALIQMKADGEEFEVPEAAAEKPNVVDIMAALEASVAAAKESRTRHPAAAAKDADVTALPTKADIAAGAKKSAAKKRTQKKPAKSAGTKSATKKSTAKKSAAKSTTTKKKAAAKKSAKKSA